MTPLDQAITMQLILGNLMQENPRKNRSDPKSHSPPPSPLTNKRKDRKSKKDGQIGTDNLRRAGLKN